MSEVEGTDGVAGLQDAVGGQMASPDVGVLLSEAIVNKASLKGLGRAARSGLQAGLSG